MLWRLLRRDWAELAGSAPLLILILAVPMLLLLLIGQLNVRSPLTRLAIVTEASPAEEAEQAREGLREKLREISSIEWVEWTTGSEDASPFRGYVDAGDIPARAVRERIDIVIIHANNEWRAYSAVTRVARVGPAQEVAGLLAVALQREKQAERQLKELDKLVERLNALTVELGALKKLSAKLSATQNAKALEALAQHSGAREPQNAQVELVTSLRDLVSAAARVEIPTTAYETARELQEHTRRMAALPTSLEGAWLTSQLERLWAPGSAEDHTLVPSYIGLIVVFVPFVLASSALVREREASTLQGLLVAVRRRWPLLIAGKLLLPVLAGLLVLSSLLVVASLVFGFGIKPGLVRLLLVQSLAATVSALFGMVVSALIESAQEAYAACAAYLVALILLTGMIHPLEQSAPAVVAIAHAFPLTLSSPTLESWMTAGVAAEVPWQTWIALGAQGVAALLFCAAAVGRLKAKL